MEMDLYGTIFEGGTEGQIQSSVDLDPPSKVTLVTKDSLKMQHDMGRADVANVKRKGNNLVVVDGE